jgi:hypothetical protein
VRQRSRAPPHLLPLARHPPHATGKLLTLLQQGKRMVQEGALTALASVADCAEEGFVRYYDSVMPLLSAILQNAQAKEHRLLRAKALECVSLVGMAVGRERFRGDAAAVMAFMAQLSAAQLDADDPTHSYMLQAGARLCKALGPEFLPYLPLVMPPLLKSARLEPEVKVSSADEPDDDDEDDDDVEHIQLGDKVCVLGCGCAGCRMWRPAASIRLLLTPIARLWGCHTHTRTHTHTHTHTLAGAGDPHVHAGGEGDSVQHDSVLPGRAQRGLLPIRAGGAAQELGGCWQRGQAAIACSGRPHSRPPIDNVFAPPPPAHTHTHTHTHTHLPLHQQVTQLMVPLLKFYFHEEVRRAATSAMPELLRATQAAVDKGVPGASADMVGQMVGFMWEPLVAALKKEPETDLAAAMLDALAGACGVAAGARRVRGSLACVQQRQPHHMRARPDPASPPPTAASHLCASYDAHAHRDCGDAAAGPDQQRAGGGGVCGVRRHPLGSRRAAQAAQQGELRGVCCGVCRAGSDACVCSTASPGCALPRDAQPLLLPDLVHGGATPLSV